MAQTTSAPMSWAETKPKTSSGRIPPNVRVIDLANVTAGFAKGMPRRRN